MKKILSLCLALVMILGLMPQITLPATAAEECAKHNYAKGFCSACGAEHPNMANFEGKVISILGDSISTFAGYIPTADGFNLTHRTCYPYLSLTDVNDTWWMQVITELDAKLGINDSWSGSRVHNNIIGNSGNLGENTCMASLTRIQNLGSNGTPDVILFYGGTNDLGCGVQLGSFNPESAPAEVDLEATTWSTYADAYVAAIMRMQHFYPNSIICAMLPTYTTRYYSDSRLEQYNAVMSAICDHYGVPYIDLRECGITKADLPDGIHPEAEGMDYISDAVVDALMRCDVVPGEHVVYSVTHDLNEATASCGYYRGVSAGKPFVETITGKNLKVTVTMDGSDVTDTVYENGRINIANVTGNLVITAKAVFSLGSHLQQLPENTCAGTNLWTALTPENDYYSGTQWVNKYYSITFPVTSGDRIAANSFGAAGTNGHNSTNGIHVTFFDEYGVLKSMPPAETYKEYMENGWITAPAGAVAVNVGQWDDISEGKIFLLNRSHDYKSIITAPTCTEQGYTAYTCDCGDSYVDDYVDAVGHIYKNGVCTACGGSVTDQGYTHAIPENPGVQNAIDRAHLLTDVEWTPLRDVPGVQEIDGTYTVVNFEAGVAYRGIPYSGVIANDCYVGLNVSLESFLTALENENSVLYTENLFNTNPKSATYFGTVCSKFAQYVLDVPGSYNTNNVANIPGMDTIAMPGKYTVDQIKLGDVILDTVNHTTVCTDILYDADGNVAYVEISEAVMPLVRRMLWSPEEFYGHFADYRLCRYQYLNAVPAADAVDLSTHPALMPRYGNKYNYTASTSRGIVDVLESGYHKAVILRDGTVADEIILNGAASFTFDRSVPGSLEMYLEKADGTRSKSVYACVVNSSITVTDSSKFAAGKLTVTFDGSSGTPLYVQIGSAHAIFCNVKGAEGTLELTFPTSRISTRQVRVAYQNEYGIYLSSWVPFTAEENPSDDPLLSQGRYWNGYNITPGSPAPVVQENKAGYWAYTMIPVEENTAYYSQGATRMWFLDDAGNGISTYNAYKDSEIPFQFTTPAGTAYVNIAYAPDLVEQGAETLEKVVPEHIHDYSAVVTAPTCTEQGYTTHTCTTCGDSYVDTYVPVAGHNIGAWTQTKAPACAEKGYERRDCANCDYCENREIAAIGHSYKAAATAPTCTAQGYTTHTCVNCGDSYVDSYVDATGHSFDDGVCTLCGQKDYRNVTYVAFGDSITYGVDGNYRDGPGRIMDNPYPKLVGQLLDFGTVDNRGVSGGTLCADSGRTNMTERILNFHGEADVISVMLGVNDYQMKCPMGDIDSTDNKTIFGSLNLICQHLTENYPDAFLFFMTPFQYRGGENDRGAGYNLPAVADAIKQVAAKYGIPVLDMYTYGRYEEEFNDTSLAYQDGIHPSQQHHIKYTAPMIAEFIAERYEGPNADDSQGGQETDGRIIYRQQALTKGYCTKAGEVVGSSVHSYFTMDAEQILTITITPPDAPAWNPLDIYYIVIVEEDGTVSCYGKLDQQEPTVIELGGHVKGTVYFNAFYDDHPEYVYVKEAIVVTHEHVYETEVTAPTCTAQGYTTHTCTTCGSSYVDTYIPAVGHSFGAWTQTKAPTCQEKGEERRDCVNCDHCENRETAATGHSYKAVATAPSCTAQGYTTHTCTTCGDSYVDTYVDALGHSFKQYVSNQDATCTVDGTKTAKCQHCGVTDTVTDPYSAAGHSFGAWTQTKAPTCMEMGAQRRDCANCDHYETREIAAKGHIYVAVVTAPTCTAQGYTTHTCVSCGNSYVDSYVPAVGHRYGAWTQTKAPTCTEKGEERRDCANCDYCESREIAATGHSYKAVAIAPTCTAQGYTTHTCVNCGDSHTDTYTPASGHVWGNWEVIKPAAPGEPGGEKRVCSFCGAEERREIPALGYLPGDVNGDGTVDVDDAIHLLFCLLIGETDYPVNQSCDFNASGAEDVDDAIYLLFHVLIGSDFYPLK